MVPYNWTFTPLHKRNLWTIFALLRCYAAYIGSYLPTFRETYQSQLKGSSSPELRNSSLDYFVYLTPSLKHLQSSQCAAQHKQQWDINECEHQTQLQFPVQPHLFDSSLCLCLTVLIHWHLQKQWLVTHHWKKCDICILGWQSMLFTTERTD
jgi:hypothetical protein